MGRGDKRTAKGKRTRASFGNSRGREKLKARARKAAMPKPAAKPAAETPTA
ncbi:MAG: 30S ribosomal protein THX [Planctomycetaceae bacterium]|nr:30S ribosomal protein THX [Planctomycetaceae bacterium]